MVAIPSGSQTWRQTRRAALRVGDGASVAPRTAMYAVKAELRRRRGDPLAGPPNAEVSASLLAQVAVDELVLGFFRSSGRTFDDEQLRASGEEILEADRLFAAHGWTEAPARYHVDPPTLDDAIVRRRWLGPTRFELLLAP